MKILMMVLLVIVMSSCNDHPTTLDIGTNQSHLDLLEAIGDVSNTTGNAYIPEELMSSIY